MGLNRVLFRSIGNKLSEGTTKIMGCRIPSGATSFDYVTASGKRNFRVLTFKDEAGKPVLKKIDFLNGEGAKTRYVEQAPNRSHTIYNTDSKNESLCIRSMTQENGKTYMIQNEMTTGNPDRHSLFALEQGKQRKGITYKAHWDGNKPNLEYINIDKKMDDTRNLEYLPLSVEFSNSFRTKQRIAHISAIQEKQLGLEGLAPKPQIVDEADIMSNTKYICDGETNPNNGQIKISNKVREDSATLLSVLGHEYRHLKDFFNMHRIKFETTLSPDETSKIENEAEKLYPGTIKFDKTAESKGFLKKNSKMENKYKKIHNEVVKALSGNEYSESAKGHDSFGFERRANASGQKEVDKLWEVANRVEDFILNA